MSPDDTSRPMGFPAELEAWIRTHARPAPGAGGSTALDRGVAALGEALRRPGRDREGAHALLAADALLTGACENTAGEGDPEARLLEALERLVGQGGE